MTETKKPFNDIFQTVLDQINDGVYFVDRLRRITYWNQAAERITGYRREQVVGQFCMANILMHVNSAGEQLCHGACPLAKTLLDAQPRESEVYLHHADGHRLPVAVRVTPIFEGDQVVGAVEIFTENLSLTSAMLRIEELQREVMLDSLTTIGNRRSTQARLEMAFRELQANHSLFGVLMIDIDHFKQVNDTYGHEIGDRVLKMVAQSISSGLRAYDFVGRWGGEEFLAILPAVDEEALTGIAERLRMLVENSHLFLDGGDRRMSQAVRVTISQGGALVSSEDTPESLLTRADQNLYRSKAAGRNRLTL